LELSRKLNKEIFELERAKEEVRQQQCEAQKQGLLVKKMTNYMSEEIERLELACSKEETSQELPNLSQNLEKLSQTEAKLRVLRGRLDDFINGDDESLRATDSSLSVELKRYESFVLDLINVLNEKIATFEKIVNRIQGENRESQQQKLLLKEMVQLFNDEIDELEETFVELKIKKNPHE
jgi:hypothetical protein